MGYVHNVVVIQGCPEFIVQIAETVYLLLYSFFLPVFIKVDYVNYDICRPHGKRKYQSVDNTKIGIKRGNSLKKK